MSCCKRMWNALLVHFNSVLLILPPVAFAPVFLTNNIVSTRCVYVALIMFIWWMTECVPLPVTSLVPMALFPIMGVLDSPRVSTSYLKEANMLFLGGLILAIAIEDCGLHTRIALKLIHLVGANPRRICFALSGCVIFAAQWMSNTAAVTMIIPIMHASLEEMDNYGICDMFANKTTIDASGKTVPTPPEELKPSRITICFYLSCAYCATIAGTGTIIGTATNMASIGIYESLFPDSPGIDFNTWAILNIPIMAVLLIAASIWLQTYFMGLFRPNSNDAQAIRNTNSDNFMNSIQNKIAELGPWTFREVVITILFSVAVILLVFRDPRIMPGWPTYITQHVVKDGATLIAVAFLLFTLPGNLNFIHMFSSNEEKNTHEESAPVVPFKVFEKKMPWGIVILLGGAFALADGILTTGAGKLVAGWLTVLTTYPPYIVQMITFIVAMIATEFTANVAMVNILTPIVGELSIQAQIHPIYLCMPVAVASSFSFCLPVGTPPNALVKDAGNLPGSQMLLSGAGLKIIVALLYLTLFNLYAPVVFGDISIAPDWINTTKSVRQLRGCF